MSLTSGAVFAFDLHCRHSTYAIAMWSRSASQPASATIALASQVLVSSVHRRPSNGVRSASAIEQGTRTTSSHAWRVTSSPPESAAGRASG